MATVTNENSTITMLEMGPIPAIMHSASAITAATNAMMPAVNFSLWLALGTADSFAAAALLLLLVRIARKMMSFTTTARPKPIIRPIPKQLLML